MRTLREADLRGALAYVVKRESRLSQKRGLWSLFTGDARQRMGERMQHTRQGARRDDDAYATAAELYLEGLR